MPKNPHNKSLEDMTDKDYLMLLIGEGVNPMQRALRYLYEQRGHSDKK